jgi:hypothetical protein
MDNLTNPTPTGALTLAAAERPHYRGYRHPILVFIPRWCKGLRLLALAVVVSDAGTRWVGTLYIS